MIALRFCGGLLWLSCVSAVGGSCFRGATSAAPAARPPFAGWLATCHPFLPAPAHPFGEGGVRFCWAVLTVMGCPLLAPGSGLVPGRREDGRVSGLGFAAGIAAKLHLVAWVLYMPLALPFSPFLCRPVIGGNFATNWLPAGASFCQLQGPLQRLYSDP